MSELIASAGPFLGVRTAIDRPYTNSSTYLYDATNGYLPDAANASSWVTRPGFSNPNGSAQIGTGQRTQGTYAHVDPTTGTIYRFFVVNGHLYRANSTFTAFTDVTPGAVTIDASTYRVSFASVGASLIVTDGVNRPWVASSLGATPIVGTYIDIDGAGNAWSTWGKPTVYQDSVFFITQTVPGGSAVTPRVGIVWSEPNQPTVGYTQSGFADFWNLIENGSDPLYAILGTNNGLFYWRQNAIGVCAGTPSLSFSTTATRDARGISIGTVSPWAVTVFENTIFFVDALARPYMMPLDGDPQPIWQQNPDTFSGSVSTNLTPNSITATGAIVPELNRYLVAPISALPASNASPEIAYAFNAQTGAYDGQWSIRSGIGLDVIAQQRDANGATVLCICGGKTNPGDSGGYVWILNSLASNVWLDDGLGIGAQIYTEFLGYDADVELLPDHLTLIVHSTQNMFVTPWTDAGSQPSQLVTPIGNSGAAIQYRATLGLDGNATRTLRFQVRPTGNGNAHWGVMRLNVFGSHAASGPDDA